MIHSCNSGTGREALNNMQKFCLCSLRESINISLYCIADFCAFFL